MLAPGLSRSQMYRVWYGYAPLDLDTKIQMLPWEKRGSHSRGQELMPHPAFQKCDHKDLLLPKYYINFIDITSDSITNIIRRYSSSPSKRLSNLSTVFLEVSW